MTVSCRHRTGEGVLERASPTDAPVLRWTTYETFAPHRPDGEPQTPSAGLIADVPGYVDGRTCTGRLRWEGSTLLERFVATIRQRSSC